MDKGSVLLSSSLIGIVTSFIGKVVGSGLGLGEGNEERSRKSSAVFFSSKISFQFFFCDFAVLLIAF